MSKETTRTSFDSVIIFRIEKDKKKQLQENAKKRGIDFSDYLRLISLHHLKDNVLLK
jgi:hypothetical protein